MSSPGGTSIPGRLAVALGLIALFTLVWFAAQERATGPDVGAEAARWAATADAAAADGDWALAISALDEAVALQPEEPRWRSKRGDATVELVLGDEAAASERPVESLRRITRSTAADARVLAARGRLLAARGQSDRAIAILKKAVEADGELGVARYDLGRLLYAAGDLDGARIALQRAVVLSEEIGLARYYLGEVALKQGHAVEASGLLEKLAELRPDDARVQSAYGRALAETKDWMKAVIALEVATRQEPSIEGVYTTLGRAYVATRRLEPALQAFVLAWKVDRDIEALRARARVLSKLSRHEEALTALQDVLGVDPDDPEAMCQLGASASVLKQFQPALDALGRCLELTAGKKEHEKRYKSAGELAERLKAQLGVGQEKPKQPGR